MNCGQSVVAKVPGADAALVGSGSPEDAKETAIVSRTPISPGEQATALTPAQSSPTVESSDPRLSVSQLGSGSVIANRYEILGVLGIGGMGSVFRARDRELDRIVALKTIRPELVENPDILMRFKQELILARDVTHKNVNRIFDLGEYAGFKFITMEFVDGEDLKDLLRREGRLAPDRAAQIIVQICAALEAAHSEGVVHRDLKPQNIMLDKTGRVVVMDFGLARSTESGGMTQTGMTLGTPHYMSPEQVIGEKAGPASDLFTLGIIFYELLTGELPYQADSPYGLMVQRTQRIPDPPIEKVPDIPQYMNDAIVKCLQIEPQLRYQDASDLIEDLQEQRKPAVTSKFSRVSGKRSAPVISWKWLLAGLLIAVLIAVGMILSTGVSESPAVDMEAQSVSLAVLPFQNNSGDPDLEWLGTGLTQMLATEIGQSSQLRTVSSDRIYQIFQDLRINPDTVLDSGTLRRVAEFTNAKILVRGKYMRLGDQIRVDATLQDFTSGRTVPIKAEAANEADLLDAVSDLVESIQAALDVSRSTVDELQAQAFRPSTQSVEALRFYNEGLEEARQGSDLEAAARFEAATEADPDFALAFSELGQTQANLGYSHEAERSSSRALGLAGALPQREKLVIEAHHARIISDLEQAIEAYEHLVRLSPADLQVQFELAELHEAKGNFEEARNYYQQVLEADPKYFDALYAAGRNEIRSRNYEGSLDFLNRALSIAVRLDRPQSKASVLQAIGIAYKNMNQLSEALQYYGQSLELKQEVGDRRGAAASFNEMGQVYKLLGELDRATENYQLALEIQREIGDRDGRSLTLDALSGLLQQRGEYDEALGLAREALQIQMELGNKSYQSLFQGNIGALYFLKGQYEDALTYYESALQTREQLGVDKDIAETLYNIAETYTRTGQLDRALDNYLRALELWRAESDEWGIAFASFGLGTLFEQQGRFAAALSARKEALAALQKLDDRSAWLGDTLAGYGRALSLLGRNQESAEQLKEALTFAEDLGHESLMARVLNYEGDRYFYLNRSGPARNSYQKALTHAAKGTDPYLKLLSRLNLAKLDTEEAPGKPLTERLRELHGEAGSKGLRYLETEASIYLGKALLKDGNLKEARLQLEDSVRKAERMGFRALSVQAHYLLARAASGLGDAPTAESHTKQAERMLSEMQEEAGNAPLLERADLAALRLP